MRDEELLANAQHTASSSWDEEAHPWFHPSSPDKGRSAKQSPPCRWLIAHCYLLAGRALAPLTGRRRAGSPVVFAWCEPRGLHRPPLAAGQLVRLLVRVRAGCEWTIARVASRADP